MAPDASALEIVVVGALTAAVAAAIGQARSAKRNGKSAAFYIGLWAALLAHKCRRERPHPRGPQQGRERHGTLGP